MSKKQCMSCEKIVEYSSGIFNCCECSGLTVQLNNQKMEDKKQTYFYMLYMENGSAPTYKHNSLTSAENEAERLTKMTGNKVYVLTTIKSFQEKRIDVVDCRPPSDDNLPF